MELETRAKGALLGTALGDALGLAMEGLSAKVIARRFPHINRFYLFANIGWVSDDTEQSALVASCIAYYGNDLPLCRKAFRSAMRRWFLSLPWGLGWGTLKACIKLLFGREHSASNSAGNGAAMRSAIVGIRYFDDPATRHAVVRTLSEVTHDDARAVEGALYVAEIAALCVTCSDRSTIVTQALDVVNEPSLKQAIQLAIDSAHQPTDLLSDSRTIGNTGFVNTTCALATYIFLRYQNSFMEAIENTIRCGGDTDSIAAIVGAWIGTLVGDQQLPKNLLDRLQSGTYGRHHLEALAHDVVASRTSQPSAQSIGFVSATIRNLLMYPLILTYAFRSLVPW
jgi:ADP-ribosyl-[dinitrogen reductase] hydrolase